MNRLVFKLNKGRASILSSSLLAFLFAFMLANPALAKGSEHHQAYLDALDTVVAAQSRIGGEMTRISNGTVAHFDFLQHQHIELLRHASALRHPPTQITAKTRDGVIAKADALLNSAESLEVVIADFLRAQALLNSAVSNTLDLLKSQPNQRLTNAELNNVQQLAQAAREFHTRNTVEARKVLYAAYDKVASVDIQQVWKNELLAQRLLIQNNASEAAAGVSKLAAAEISSLAERLQSAYLSTISE